MHEYIVFPTTPKPGFVLGKPRRMLPEVEFHVNEAGGVGDSKYPINQSNAVVNGFNNMNFTAFSDERKITEQYFDNNARCAFRRALRALRCAALRSNRVVHFVARY